MPKLRHKKSSPREPFNVRLNSAERALVAKAAKVIAAERGVEEVELATLFREVGMRGVREIAARALPEPMAVAS
jgi:hypothetical protein